MACLVPQVSLELLADQESPADQEHQGCQERRVRQVGTGSQDRLESKESQVSSWSTYLEEITSLYICLTFCVVYMVVFFLFTHELFLLQGFLDTVVLVLLGFQGCQVRNDPLHVTVFFFIIIVSALI